MHAANPLKLREYLSMGLPIVSVSTPEIDKFAHVVAIARTREAFRDAVVAALAEPASAAAVERRQAVAREGTWAARVDQIWERLRTVLDEKSVGAA